MEWNYGNKAAEAPQLLRTHTLGLGLQVLGFLSAPLEKAGKLHFLLTLPLSPLLDFCTLSATWNATTEPPECSKLCAAVCKAERKGKGVRTGFWAWQPFCTHHVKENSRGWAYCSRLQFQHSEGCGKRTYVSPRPAWASLQDLVSKIIIK